MTDWRQLKGGFILAETESVRALHHALSLGLTSLHDATLDDKLRTSEVMRMYATSLRDGVKALALLLGVNPEAENSPEFNSRELESRPAWVASSFWHLGRTTGLWMHWTPYLWGSAQTWLQQALDALKTIDASLVYATPYPDDVRGLNGQVTVAITPTVVGPHGYYRIAQWALQRAAHYYLDALEDAAQTPAPDKVVFQKGSEFLRVIAESMTTLADLPMREIPAHSQRPDMPPRFLHVEKVMEWLTDSLNPFSVPFRANEILRDAELSKHAVSRIADAWRHADQACWNCMGFFLVTP